MQHFFSAWETVTSDSYILQAVKGYKIEFIGSVGPHQTHLLWEIGFNAQECDIVDQEIVKLLLCSNPNMRMENLFLTFFFVERKILNLKCFKENVSKHHFKMESLQSAVRFMKPGCYMASVDLKDAYYSVPIHQSHQKFLTFSWRGKLFQFTCLPKGLSSAPRCFTKILKPVYATLGRAGHDNVGYIDDQYLQGDTKDECLSNVSDTMSLLTK